MVTPTPVHYSIIVLFQYFISDQFLKHHLKMQIKPIFCVLKIEILWIKRYGTRFQMLRNRSDSQRNEKSLVSTIFETIIKGSGDLQKRLRKVWFFFKAGPVVTNF